MDKVGGSRFLSGGGKASLFRNCNEFLDFLEIPTVRYSCTSRMIEMKTALIIAERSPPYPVGIEHLLRS